MARVGQPQEFAEALRRCYAQRLPAGQLFRQLQSHTSTAQVLSEQPDCLVYLLEWVLLCASRQGASDIHFSPDRLMLHIRFRVDGVMRCFDRVSNAVQSGLLVRIKILAGMDIAESRHPQDGQFTQLIDARDIDFRVSCFPTVAGQNTVIRLLDPQRRLDSLAGLNLPTTLHDNLAALVQRPDGLLVICGPTGSGKSTTLHALLNERDAQHLNIMTLEDPVEQMMPGIRQTSIDAAHGLDYAKGVRGLLRQDPDVLLIGEIRDADSCAMALRAVMSGHQVLTTVHATSALAGLSRLRELGALPSLLASNLVAIASQRLVRKCCTACAFEPVDAEEQVPVGGDKHLLDSDDDEQVATHCPHCNGSGYQGRQVIMELLIITPALATLIAQDASTQALATGALRDGFLPLWEQGQQLINQGVSRTDELERVLGRRHKSLLPH
jgi:general secretion pathway protein E/type IV pilus assembly protein PilB